MQVIYARSRIGEFIENLDHVTWSHVLKIISRLQIHSNNIGPPFSKSLGNGLFELRIVGKKQVRLIYVFNQDKAYILHVFIKKTWTIPKKELEYAKSVRKNLFA